MPACDSTPPNFARSYYLMLIAYCVSIPLRR